MFLNAFQVCIGIIGELPFLAYSDFFAAPVVVAHIDLRASLSGNQMERVASSSSKARWLMP